MAYDFNSLDKVKEEQPADLKYYRDYTNISDTIPEVEAGKKDNVSVTLARWIRQKMYGRDVRESIAQFVEWVSVLTNKAIDKVDDNAERQTTLEEQFQSVLNETTSKDVISAPEIIAARGGKATLGERLDETDTQLQQTVDYINNGTRKFKPKICNNLWFVNRNEATMRNMVQSQLDMGIEGFILCFHLDVNETYDGFTVQENIADMLKVVTEFYNKGVYFSALKFHCTDSILATSTTLQNAYKTLVLDYINMFNGLGIKHCIIFNERNDMFRTENISYIRGLLNEIKLLGLKVSINANSTGTMIANYRDFSDATSIYDFISVNMYPQIGAKGRGTTLTDCLDAWEEHSRFNNILSSNKPFILTETGMRPYWLYFSSPAGYEYDDPNDYSIDAQILYFKGLFESGMNDLADEVWLWFFPEFYDEKIASLVKYYTGKGDLAIE